MENSRKGRNGVGGGHKSAMTRPTEKKKKYGPSYFSCTFHVLNFKILALTVLARKMDAHTHRRTGPNQYAPLKFCEAGGIKNKGKQIPFL